MWVANSFPQIKRMLTVTIRQAEEVWDLMAEGCCYPI